MFIFTDNYQV